MDTSDWHGSHDRTDLESADPSLVGIFRYPLKSLDPERRESAVIVSDGALRGDRRWAILDRPATAPYDASSADVTGAGDFMNGKKTDAIHRLRSTFHEAADGGPAVTLREHTTSPTAGRRFTLYDGEPATTEAAVHAPLNEWISAYFDRPVSVRRDSSGQHDDTERHGPTVISTATLREIAAWFDITVDSARRRFRANLEIGGVPPFWEDVLFTGSGSVVGFRIGTAIIEGVHPCQRCVVPGRDPDTGAKTADFRETFIRRRQETLPPWTACDRFDHPFRLMVNTRVPRSTAGTEVSVGDPVEIIGERPE